MKYLFGFLLVAMLITPVMAQTYSFTAPTGKAVWSIDVEAQWGSSGTIIMHQSNGDTTTATWSYAGYPAIANTQIGSDSKSFTYMVPTNLKMQVWNGDNVSLARQLKLGAGEVSGVWNTVAQTPIGAYPITSYEVSSVQTFTVSEEVVSYSKAMQDLNPENSDAVGYVLSLVWMFIGFIKVLVYWLTFFFITGIVMITALYIAITGAISFGSGRNIFTALRKFFKYQKAYVEFIVYLWVTLISIASYIRSLFKFV